jgi:hypothetical protein
MFFIGCEEIPDDVINSTAYNYNVTNIEAPESFIFSNSDSSFVAAVEIDNTEVINEVWLDVVSQDGSEEIIDNLSMADNGDTENNGDEAGKDSKYSAKVFLGKDIASGNYEIQFYVSDNYNDEDDNVRKAAVHVFAYDNGENKFEPVISNLIMPDTISTGVEFVFTVDVTDQNGLSDVDEVYFDIYRSDGAYRGRVVMHDDGDSNYGDETAGDGVYSFKNSFESTALKGTWRFVFQAVDKSGLVSNEITHNIEVI